MRLKAYGELDFLNVLVGEARNLVECEIDEILKKVQTDLMALSSILATRDQSSLFPNIAEYEFGVEVLEGNIDKWWSEMPELRNFILPAGSDGALKLHQARAVCRSAERLVVELASEEDVPEIVLKYLNRLSDFFFAGARYVNFLEGIDDEPVDY